MSEPIEVIRILFQVIDGKIKPFSKVAATMTAPAIVGSRPADATGLPVRLMTAANQNVFEAASADLIPHSVEVFGLDGENSIGRISLEGKPMAFEIIVPKIDGAKTIEFGPAVEGPRLRGMVGATPLSFDLDEIPG